MGRLFVVAMIALPLALYYGDQNLNSSKFTKDIYFALGKLNANIATGNVDDAALEAAIAGDYRLMCYYIEDKGADPNTAMNEYRGNRLIHFPAKAGDLEAVQCIIKGGGKADQRDTKYDNVGVTAALVAAQHGHPEIVKYLMQNGADPNTAEYGPPTEAGNMPLHQAARFGGSKGLEMAEYLLGIGAKVDYKGSGGWSALTYAAERNNVAIALKLIEAGADVNWSDWDMGTPVHRAAKNGHVDVIRVLVENGANLLLTNKAGDTPLKIAEKSGKHKALVEYLKEVTPEKKKKKRYVSN